MPLFYTQVFSQLIAVLVPLVCIYIYIYLRRNWLLQRVIEGKIQKGIEVTGRQGRRHRMLLDDLKERKGYSHLKEEALDRTMWRARFERGFGPVVRQTTKCMKTCIYFPPPSFIFDNLYSVLYMSSTLAAP
jgi:hypothetical protein